MEAGKMEEKKERKDFGYANGWKETPTEVVMCGELGHEIWIRNEGKCLNKYGCDICGYTYLVDSSD